MAFIKLLYGMFFFSSRRRHTRLQGDWSSDVCSSDLPNLERLVLHNTEPWYFDGSGRGRQVRDQEFTSRFFWDIHDKFPMLRHLGVHIDEYKRIIEEKRGSLPSLSNLWSFQNTDSCHGGFLPNQSILVQLLPSKLAALDLTFTTNTWGKKL